MYNVDERTIPTLTTPTGKYDKYSISDRPWTAGDLSGETRQAMQT